MKLLYIRQISPVYRCVETAFEKLGIDYTPLDYNFSDMEKDDTFCGLLSGSIAGTGYDAVFSFGFIPVASGVCQSFQVKYLSWVYDCPLPFMNQEPLLNSCNEVFFFDRIQAHSYASAGVNAHHLPFAVDTEYFANLLKIRKDAVGNDSEKMIYSADISLAADIYRNGYSELGSRLQPYLRGYFEGIVSAQSKLYGAYLIPELVTDDLVAAVGQCYNSNAAVKKMPGVSPDRQDVEYMLACEVTNRERLGAMELLKESRRYNVEFYNDIKDDYSRLSFIYSGSRINLNITNKAVQSGIVPQALEIMACGGFLLTNYQEEIAEYLKPGEACVIYESMEDLADKAAYYLEHEAQRLKLAQAGRELVEQNFTFEEKIRSMFGTL